MTRSQLILILIASSAPFSHAYADEDKCLAISTTTKKATDAITEKYTSLINSTQDKIKTEADAIQSDAKTPDNAVEGTLKFKIDISSHIETIKLDLPTVTVRNKDIVFGVPEVTMKQQTWKYDIPQTKMVTHCIDGLPETVCSMQTKDFGLFKTDVPVCSTRKGSRMCTDIPEVWMGTTETVLGVPEVTMKDQKIIIGIPEFKMETQEIKFTVPDFTFRNLEAEMQKTKDRSADLSTRAQTGVKSLSDGMQTEIKKVSKDGVNATIACEKTQLDGRRADAVKELDNNISVVQAALTQANNVKALDLASKMHASLDELVNARKKLNDQFDKAVADMVNGIPGSVSSMQ